MAKFPLGALHARLARRSWRRRGSWLAAAAVALALLTAPSWGAAGGAAPSEVTAARAAAARPNVILFLTDDQALSDMKALPYVRKRIGGQGTTFTRAFAQYPLCCPARATLLTGQYAHNTGVMSNEPPHGGVGKFREAETLPVWLSRAGYNTVALSKYLNGYDQGTRRVPPGWTEWQVPVRDIYDYRSFTMNENGALVDYHKYQAAHWRDRGVQLVKKYAAKPNPFFLWAGFLAPHTGTPIEADDPQRTKPAGLPTPAVSDQFRNDFAKAKLPRKPSFMEANMSDKPGVRGRSNRPRSEFTEVYQQRLESLLSVNSAIRAILKALDRTGEADNTVLIFTSDNGHMVGEHRRFSKTLGYEESVRVPMLISGPGFSRSVRRDQLVTLADLASTITQTAGTHPAIKQDGRPL